MNARELLELAAKAAGYEFRVEEDQKFSVFLYDRVWTLWNPLKDDGDALRLAVATCLPLEIEDEATHVRPLEIFEPHWGDPLLATRLCIVRAAAEIGRRL